MKGRKIVFERFISGYGFIEFKGIVLDVILIPITTNHNTYDIYDRKSGSVEKTVSVSKYLIRVDKNEYSNKVIEEISPSLITNVL